MSATKPRVRKSVKLSKEEFKAFENWVKKQPTKVDAIEVLGINMGTLDRVLMSGGGHQFTVEKIQKVLANA